MVWPSRSSGHGGFLKRVAVETYRIKGFGQLTTGHHKIDVVHQQIDLLSIDEEKPSTLVFISKVGIQVIRTIDAVWKEEIGIAMKVSN